MKRPHSLSHAKISEPRPREVYVRKRLFRALDAATRRPVVWVEAAAGSGKTIVVHSWLEARRIPRVWFQVDEGDADVASFFHYMTLAARRFGSRGAPLPAITPDVPVAPGGFSRRFFEGFYERLPPRAAVVLDNYQDAPGGALDEVVRAAYEVLRPGVTLVVVSRTPPAPTLARALASDDLGLIDASSLRLEPDEVRGLARVLRRDRKTPTRPAEVDAMHRVTGGWAAGVVLLLGRDEIAPPRVGRNPDAAAGAAKLERVFEYFTTELLDRTDATTRRFLLETSLLPWMSERAAAELTQVRRAGMILARLSGQNFFTERHGGSPAVYQYHPLFRAFLLDRAQKTFSQHALGALRKRAARVLVEGGQIEAGLELMRLCEDWEASAAVILGAAPTYMAQGRSRTLEAWLAGLPEAVVQASAWLLFWQAACSIGHDPLRSVGLLEQAFTQFRRARDADGAHLAWSAALQAIVHAGMDLAPIDAWLQRLGEIEHEGLVPSPPLRARVATGKLMALFRQPGHPSATAWADEALELSRGAGASIRAMNGGLLIPIHCFSGQLGRAASVLDLLRQSTEDEPAESLAALTLVNAEAVLQWTSADPGCLETVSRGLELARSSGIVVWNDQLAAIGAAAAFGAGDADGAAPFLAIMADAVTRKSHFAVGNYHYYAAWDAVLRGELARALASLQIAVDRSDQFGYPLARVLSRLAIAQMLARLGKRSRAQRALREARDAAAAARSDYLVFASLLTEADVRLLDGDDDAALPLLRRALELGRAHSIFNLFWWHGESKVRICARALEAGIEPEYVTDLVRRHRLAAEGPAARVEAWPWRLKLTTLGGLEVAREHAPLDARSKGQQAPLRLLLAIAALGGRDLHEEDLAAAVWPDAEGDGARTVLNTTLHRLRKLLGDDSLIRMHGGRVDLDRRLVWLDVWAFDGAAARLERAVGLGRGHDVSTEARRVMDLYRGAFLAGDESMPCFVATRERLRARFLRSVASAGGFWEERGAGERAIDLYLEALDRDDVAEPIYQRAMACLERHGRAGEALRLYERYRAVAGARLGIAPTRDTIRLSERIRTAEPARAV